MQAVSDIVCTNESFTTKINIIHVSNTFVFKDGRFKFGIIYQLSLHKNNKNITATYANFARRNMLL